MESSAAGASSEGGASKRGAKFPGELGGVNFDRRRAVSLDRWGKRRGKDGEGNGGHKCVYNRFDHLRVHEAAGVQRPSKT